MTRTKLFWTVVLSMSAVALGGCQSIRPGNRPSMMHADFGMCALADAGQPLSQEQSVYYLAAGDALGHAVFTQYVAALYTDPQYLAAIGELDVDTLR